MLSVSQDPKDLAGGVDQCSAIGRPTPVRAVKRHRTFDFKVSFWSFSCCFTTGQKSSPMMDSGKRSSLVHVVAIVEGFLIL
ncbi:hypothetical protein F2Q68_00005215 [Brassica cretica]|nr:hypothetical protein F2Q68_00005215 [Brassica cretica]